jgi:TPR repeat protein
MVIFARPDTRRLRADDWLTLAERHLEAGRARRAFEVTLEAATRGEHSAALNLGYMYDRGIGVKADWALAYRWYLVAHRNGESSGTNNIGTLHRDRGNNRRALIWFRKAVRAGSEDTNLDIAKLYLSRDQPLKAVPHLEAVLRAEMVTEDSREQSARLLRRIRRPTRRR